MQRIIYWFTLYFFEQGDLYRATMISYDTGPRFKWSHPKVHVHLAVLYKSRRYRGPIQTWTSTGEYTNFELDDVFIY